LLDRETGRAVVTDFGIARAMEAGTRLTLTGVAVGTPTYMSPEQAVGEREVDGRSDIYSLGVVGYQMLTGRLPFTAGNSMALLLKHVSERPPDIAELRPDAPPALREAIERALMKAVEDRWPSAATLRDALTWDEVPGAAWRADRREPVRYTSPRRGSAAAPRPSPPPAARPVGIAGAATAAKRATAGEARAARDPRGAAGLRHPPRRRGTRRDPRHRRQAAQAGPRAHPGAGADRRRARRARGTTGAGAAPARSEHRSGARARPRPADRRGGTRG